MAPRPRRARSANSFSAWGEPFLHRSRTPDFGAAAARTDTDCGHALLCRRPQSPPSKRVYGSPTSLGTASKPWRSTSATGARELHLPELSYPSYRGESVSLSPRCGNQSNQLAGATCCARGLVLPGAIRESREDQMPNKLLGLVTGSIIALGADATPQLRCARVRACQFCRFLPRWSRRLRPRRHQLNLCRCLGRHGEVG